MNDTAGDYGNSSSGRSFFLVFLRIFSLYVGSTFPVEISFFYRTFRVCFLITSMTFNFAFSYIFNLAIKPILLLIICDLLALEPKMLIDLVSMFQFLKFLENLNGLARVTCPPLVQLLRG